jgi:hypothetical protein
MPALAGAGTLPSYDRASVSPLTLPKECTQRLIEPTSPVLGMRFAQAIKSDPRPPRDIVAAIHEQFPDWRHDVFLSVTAYLDTIAPGLFAMCDAYMADSAPPKGGWTEVEPAAIPVEVLAPYHEQYFNTLQDLANQDSSEYGTNLELVARSEAETEAASFQNIRNTCKQVQMLKDIETAFHDVCFLTILSGGCDKLIAVNDRVMSPEVSYPRLQFSVNGFTQYVYSQLFTLPRLPELLETAYQAETRWIADARAGTFKQDFMSAIEGELLRAGFTPREALLALSYSTRNMPSLDWHYAVYPEQSLMLEVYFWKFHAMREELKGPFIAHAFPNHVFAEDPGVYHYATAALQGCEVHLAGFWDVIADLSAFVGQAGYKVHKLISALEVRKLIARGGLKYLKDLAHEQGFTEGVQVGLYGGEHGVDFCKASSQGNKE